jgi:hypothetical protein
MIAHRASLLSPPGWKPVSTVDLGWLVLRLIEKIIYGKINLRGLKCISSGPQVLGDFSWCPCDQVGNPVLFPLEIEWLLWKNVLKSEKDIKEVFGWEFALDEENLINQSSNLFYRTSLDYNSRYTVDRLSIYRVPRKLKQVSSKRLVIRFLFGLHSFLLGFNPIWNYIVQKGSYITSTRGGNVYISLIS